MFSDDVSDEKMYKKKKKQWDAAPGNRRLAVEVGFIYNIYNDVVFLTKMKLNVKNEKILLFNFKKLL